MLSPSQPDGRVLSVRDAERHFGDQLVFSAVTFDVTAGRCCAIVGANGVGKSTLLRCVIGVDRLDGGTISVDGDVVDESSPAFRSAVAAVVGDVATFAHLTAHEHLQLVATAHGMPEPYELATQTLADVGLSGAADQLPVTLSSGQRRRLAVASAFVRPRRLLVLDEPEQHLDAAGRAWLVTRINAEKELGTAVLVVSHDSTLVSAVADDTVDGDSWR
ncbi:ABC transporter ATP-binding protein [Rhodococcus spongiicola]|uniref:ABC transporter ATP-binding protein n=1 Tax=Rhodococcus spongiicola TaxID=2487352 RepID=A0A3S3BQ86_9NOCA|nr:ABC transporter ATP-binding protein [Rhodococcus spongiicola]RVW06661.1 ABC transporter ATP-binding protein [Rhodococcus spongiicola]